MHEQSEDFFEKQIISRQKQERLIFQFPPSSFVSEEFTSFNQVIAQIEKLELIFRHPNKKLFQKKNRNGYLYLICRFCTSMISAKTRAQKVIFVRFKNTHNHSSRNSKQIEENHVLTEINTLLQSHTMDQTKRIIKTSFKLTYNLIKTRSISNRQYGVGFFAGLSPGLQIIIFGFCFISRETKQSFIRLFSNFLQMVEKQPSCIVTDQQSAIHEALLTLKERRLFSGQHYFDAYHILKNIRKKTTKQNLIFYKNLIKARNRQQYEIILRDLLSQQQKESNVRSFDEKSEKYCFSQLDPKIFVGFGCSSSHNQKLNDMVKKLIPRQTNILVFIREINRLIKKNNERAQFHKQQLKQYQILFGDWHLGELRKLVSSKIFAKILLSYVKGLRMQSQLIGQSNYFVSNLKTKYLVFKTEGNKWKCQCSFLQKTGTPCEHIFRILWKTRQFEYINYVSKIWLIQKDLSKEARGRPKNSRKNQIP